jgi:hypothetical protein
MLSVQLRTIDPRRVLEICLSGFANRAACDAVFGKGFLKKYGKCESNFPAREGLGRETSRRQGFRT